MVRRFKIPLWVHIVYNALEWVDYRVVSPASRYLMDWRIRLLDHYCTCEKCQGRDPSRARKVY
jgi:hypothetical protein